jgi:hypothetical protein
VRAGSKKETKKTKMQVIEKASEREGWCIVNEDGDCNTNGDGDGDHTCHASLNLLYSPSSILRSCVPDACSHVVCVCVCVCV